MSNKDYKPPKRKEPGLIGKSISAVVQLSIWLLVSLLISIIVEFIGISYFWPEQGENHAKQVLKQDLIYLNTKLKLGSHTYRYMAADKSINIKNGLGKINIFDQLKQATHHSDSKVSGLVMSIYTRYEQHWQAIIPVTQIFVIRLALIMFSLPAFLLAAGMGAVDGLVERDLRRWGGGRESSNVYNLARRSVIPTFILACMIYISLPMSINPAIVILPFALAFGLAVRVGFDRLKKYF